MDYNDRELLVYRIISGEVRIPMGDKTIKVLPPTPEVYLESCEKYYEVFRSCRMIDNIKTQEEMVNYMVEAEIWSFFDSKDLKEKKDKIDDIKLACYHSRLNKQSLNIHKLMLRKLEEEIEDLTRREYRYYAQTVDGLAAAAKLSYIIENSTYLDGELYRFEERSLESITMDYNRFHEIDEHILRKLAREEPWRSKWIIKDVVSTPLFFHSNRELTVNQKSLISWSKMYDNVYESPDCPDRYIIEDDDLLDGWFIDQSRKREKEKAQQDMENTIKSSKIKNSEEVFRVVNSKESFDKVDSLNNPVAKSKMKQREAMIKSKGVVHDHQLPDKQQQIQMQATNQMRGRVKNG